MTKAAELAKMGEVLTNSQIGGRRNIIINGGMQVAQRGTSATGITSNGYHAVDRMFYTRGSATTPTWTLEQSTDVPSGQGFNYSFKGTITTAHTIASGSVGYFQQKIEAQNVQQLSYGTSNAKTSNASFWVKSNVTGTYIVELFQQDATKYLSASITINSANTWEKKSVIFIGDTAGTINNDNGHGLSVRFIMFAGTDYTSGTLTTTWQATSNKVDRYVGQVDVADTISNYWQITGVQLEVGEQATPFEHRSFGEELALCQRYYAENNIAKYTLNVIRQSDNLKRGNIQFPTVMRASPSCAFPDATLDGQSLGTVTPNKAGVFITGASIDATVQSIVTYTADAEL